MVTAHALLLALALPGSSDAVLLEFSAAWCGPCRSMRPTVRRLVEAGYAVRTFDVDQHRDIAAQFRVTSVPCYVMLVQGSEVDRVVGAASYARLQQMFEPAHGARRAAGTRDVRGQSPDGGGRRRVVGPGRAGQGHSPGAVATGGLQIGGPAGTSVRVRHDSPVERALAATVRIKVGDRQGQSMGTGTIVDRHGHEALVVTCGHIFRDSAGQGPITIDLFNGPTAESVQGKLISYDLDRDIGFVSFAATRELTPVRVAGGGQSMRRGDDVFSIGCDHGAPPSVQRSRITAVDKYLGPPNIEVAGQPVQGRSGGGLFTTDGYLIGICNAADPADNEGIFASLPTIHWELDRIGQRHIYQAQDEQLASAVPAVEAAPDSIASSPPMPAQMPLTPVVSRAAPSPAAGDLEVICIVRSRSNPQSTNQVLILNGPSQDLLHRLADESTRINSGELIPVDQGLGRGPADGPRTPVIRAQSADRNR